MPISNIDHFLMVTTFPILSSSFFFLRKVTRTWRLVTVTLHQLLTSSGCNELCLKSVYKSFAATLLFLRFQDSGNHFTLKYEMHIFKFHMSDIVQYLCFFDLFNFLCWTGILYVSFQGTGFCCFMPEHASITSMYLSLPMKQFKEAYWSNTLGLVKVFSDYLLFLILWIVVQRLWENGYTVNTVKSFSVDMYIIVNIRTYVVFSNFLRNFIPFIKLLK